MRIGYEWTSNTGGNNLHRVVVYRDEGTKASMMEPYTTLKPLGSDDPRDLWKWLATYEEKTGGNVLAIAHNGNLSNGIMFPIVDSFTGKSLDKADQAYATSTAGTALENNKSGQTSTWSNPDSGNSGTITPIQTSYNESGEPCREYQQTVIIGGEELHMDQGPGPELVEGIF